LRGPWASCLRLGVERRVGAIGHGPWPVGSYHAERAVARRAFIVVPYEVASDGKLAPRWPSAGPCATGDGPACRLRRSHRRERKTGPRHPLVVASCAEHGCAFTLYPPGHVPYGRRAIAPVASDGAPVVAGEGRPLAGFEATCFRAAIDAAEGRAWARGGPGAIDRWWESQRRDLARQMVWLGVDPAVSAARRAAAAGALGVPLLVLLEQARAVEAGPGFRSRGGAICAVLRALGGGRGVWLRLAGAAYAAGLLGLPLAWDARSRSLRAPPSFRPPGTRAPPRGSCGA